MNIYLIQLSHENKSNIECAVEWLRKFYPDIKIARRESDFECLSATRTHAELGLIWKAALLTQINQSASAAQRRKDIEELVQ